MERETRMILNRGGNLSQTTELNQEVAEAFMQKADIRRDIVIVDSDRKPEVEGVDEVVVGHGLLGLRGFRPLRDLTAIGFKPQRLHALTRKGDTFPQQVWEIAVHERVIDDMVRKKGYVDRSDYEEQFLAALNKATKSGLSQALFKEKLGWQDQRVNYFSYALWFSIRGLGNQLDPQQFNIVSETAYTFAILHVVSRLTAKNLRNPESFASYRKNWKEAWLPLVPIDKWASGRLYLARNGNQLIIPREA